MKNENYLRIENNNDSLFSRQFEHYIFMGRCYVADDLNDLGLRDSSFPYDWFRTR